MEAFMQARAGRISLAVVGGAAIMMMVAVASDAQTSDPILGTWKLNVAKSKYDPGPAPKAVTLKYEAAGPGMKVSVDAETPGGPMKWGYTGSFDGKDNAVTGNPEVDAVALKRVGPTTTEAIMKKGGKVTTTNTRVVSADGKTLTITAKGSDAQGKPVHNVQVFEKQ
jgi:hypothetical protein